MRVSLPRNYTERAYTDGFAMLLQNNASREVFVLYDLVDKAMNAMFYTFEVAMPTTAQAGEYTYYIIPALSVKDIEPNVQPLISNVIRSDGSRITLAELKPETGILRYEENGNDKNIYPKAQSSFIYYQR